jgi:hypothetical protein
LGINITVVGISVCKTPQKNLAPKQFSFHVKQSINRFASKLPNAAEVQNRSGTEEKESHARDHLAEVPKIRQCARNQDRSFVTHREQLMRRSVGTAAKLLASRWQASYGTPKILEPSCILGGIIASERNVAMCTQRSREGQNPHARARESRVL